MVDPELADCGCYGCGRACLNPSHHGTHATKQFIITAFRCYECGRLFCGECAAEHFGMDPPEPSPYQKATGYTP